MLWFIKKRRDHENANQKVIEDLYCWILNHSHVMLYPIANDFPYVSIYVNPEKQLILQLLLQFFLENFIIAW